MQKCSLDAKNILTSPLQPILVVKPQILAVLSVFPTFGLSADNYSVQFNFYLFV
jgi:hypothetical protein